MVHWRFVVDWSLLLLLPLIITAKIVTLDFGNALQAVFMGLILIHVYQHWKPLRASLRKLKKSKKSPKTASPDEE